MTLLLAVPQISNIRPIDLFLHTKGGKRLLLRCCVCRCQPTQCEVNSVSELKVRCLIVAFVLYE